MLLYDIFKEHSVVCTDSRIIIPGCIFFALKGERFDANDYALEALKKGAALAVVDRKGLEGPGLLWVPDVLNALQQLANEHRKALAIKDFQDWKDGGKGMVVISLTGTNGKTTTKNLIKAVLETRYRVLATEGNLNNHIGVPLSLLKANSDTQIAIIEMGASHSGEIAQLSSIVDPDMGLVTNVGKAHLEGFGSIEGVMATKGALYEHIIARKNSDGSPASLREIFFNNQNPLLVDMLASRIRLADRMNSHLHPYGETIDGVVIRDGALLKMETATGEVISSNLVGRYNADNVLAALAVGRFFEVDPCAAAKAVSDYLPDNRSRLLQTQNNTVVVDAYNANPSSMAASLNSFEVLPINNKVVILGDMLELGAESDKEHRAVVAKVRAMKGAGIIEDAFWVGECFAKALAEEGDNKEHSFVTSAKLKDYLLAEPQKGHCILLKGSHGVKMESIIEVL